MSEQTKSRFPYYLIASLVVNGLLIGLLAGGALGKRNQPPPSANAGEFQIARGINQVASPEDRRAVRQALREAFRNTRDERRALRSAREALKQAMLADPYDQAAVQAAFVDLRAADSDVKVGLHDALALQMGKLSVEQRTAIMQNIGEGQRRRFRRRDR